MKSINTTKRAAPAPATEAQKLQAWQNSLDGGPDYRRTVEILNGGIKRFWFVGERRATFAEMQARFAKDAANIPTRFKHHGALAQVAGLIASENGINPLTGETADPSVKFEAILLPTFNWTDNADGSKTVLDEPYTP